MWYSDQYVIILRFFLYFKSATHFKILKFIHFFFSENSSNDSRHYSTESTATLHSQKNQAVYAGGRRAKDGPQLLRHGFENAVYKIMSTMAYRPFTKLCRRWHIRRRTWQRSIQWFKNSVELVCLVHAGGRRFFDRWV